MNKNIGLIGAGYWGKNLVRTFYQLGSLAKVCDSNPDILKEVLNEYPGLEGTADSEDIFNDPSIEGVVLATPAITHYSLVKKALLCRKHVFVEKPLALNVADGEELVSLAKERKRILLVGHILYYHPAVLKLKELIDRGELGKIQYIYSNRLNIGKIRSEENILWSFAPHDISIILMLLNEFPESVITSGGYYLQHNIADVTVTNLSFESGVKAHIYVSWLHPFKEQKLVVVGDKKMAMFDDVSKEKLYLYPHKVEWIGRLPVASRAEATVVPFTMEEPLRNECRHFLDCIKDGRAPRTDGEEGLRVLRILNMSEESLKTGRIIKTPAEKNAPQPSFFVHESAYVDEDVVIGEGTQVWHFSHILKNSKIGKKCKIGQNVVIGPSVTIGHGCKIQNNICVYPGVTLEDDVFCGPSMVFTNVFNPRSEIPRMNELRPTLIKKGATIGANATIICGITVGRYAFIGAGAVVTKNVPDYGLVFGNPARLAGWMCRCGEKLHFKYETETKCLACGRIYSIREGLAMLKSPAEERQEVVSIP